MKHRDRAPREDLRDRNRRAEDRYTWDKGTDKAMSTLALVVRDRDQFAREFFEWWGVTRTIFDDKPEMVLERWEAERFGARLEAAIHGVLWAAVRAELARRKTS
jgi:hypothetical protein